MGEPPIFLAYYYAKNCATDKDGGQSFPYRSHALGAPPDIPLAVYTGIVANRSSGGPYRLFFYSADRAEPSLLPVRTGPE